MGIIVCSQDSEAVGEAERIHQEISSHSTLEGKLVRVQRSE
jgi:hypothetical protein